MSLPIYIALLFTQTSYDGGLLNTLSLIQNQFPKPIKVLVVPFLLFTQIIGWTVYVHHVAPDIRWWTRKEWTQFNGQMESTTVLHTPRIINYLWFHNIFVHVPHHVDARIPFHKLPQAAAAANPQPPQQAHSPTRGRRTPRTADDRGAPHWPVVPGRPPGRPLSKLQRQPPPSPHH